MAKIVCFGNYKGGVGKTTFCFNFAAFLASKEIKTLVFDLDPQCSLSEILEMGVQEGENVYTLNDLLELYLKKESMGFETKVSTEKAIRKNKNGFYYVKSELFHKQTSIDEKKEDGMKCDVEKRGLDEICDDMPCDLVHMEFISNIISDVRNQYDYILIDCPPTSNVLTRAGFMMSDYYVIPTILDDLSINGIPHYIETINRTYNKYCVDGKQALLGQHIFGERPKLIAIAQNLYKGNTDVSSNKADLIKQLDAIGIVEDVILEHIVHNYVKIARNIGNGTEDVDIIDACGETYERIEKDIIESTK